MAMLLDSQIAILSKPNVEKKPDSHQSCDESDPFKGTQIEGMTLERLLKNVRGNNVWRTSAEIIDMQRDARRIFQAYQEFRLNPDNWDKIANESGIPPTTIRSWRGIDDVPRFLKRNKKNLTPETESERLHFAYFLGIYAYNPKGSVRQSERLEKLISDPKTNLRVRRRLGNYLGRTINNVHGRIRVQHPDFVQTLDHVYSHKFDEYVTTTKEIAAFLQGYFDNAETTLHQVHKKYKFMFRTSNSDLYQKLVGAFFDLGVHIDVNSTGEIISIQDNNSMQTLLDYGILKNAEQRRKIEEAIDAAEKTAFTVEQYYHVREIVATKVKRKEEVVLREIAEELGVNESSVRDWTTDLRFPGKGLEPTITKSVRRYKKLVDFLKINNPYETGKPLQRGEKTIFVINGTSYSLPRRVEEKYLLEKEGQARRFTEEELLQIKRELKANLEKDPYRTLEMFVRDGNQIKSIKGVEVEGLPQTDKQFSDFAYLLGIFSHNRRGFRRPQSEEVTRDLRDRYALKKVRKIVETLTCQKPHKKKGCQLGIRIQNKKFVRAIFTSLEDNFDDYIQTDQRRVAFLQGYFDGARIRLSTRGCYAIGSHDEDNLHRIMKTLFELGVYAEFDSKHQRLLIEDNNDLNALVNYKIIRDKNDIALIREMNLKHIADVHRPETYYTLRNIIRGINPTNTSRKYPWKEISGQLGVSSKVLSSWASDITHSSDPHRIPRSVKRFEKLCEVLDVPNVYENPLPVKRHEKVFFQVNNQVYVLPYETQQTFLQQRNEDELTDKTIGYIALELDKTIKGDSGTTLKIELTGNVITSIDEKLSAVGDDYFNGKNYAWHADTLLLRVDGKRYVLSRKVQTNYFKAYDIEPEPFTVDHIEHLIEEIKANKDKDKYRDTQMTFEMSDGVIRVKTIALNHTSAGGRRDDKRVIGTTETPMDLHQLFYGL